MPAEAVKTVCCSGYFGFSFAHFYPSCRSADADSGQDCFRLVWRAAADDHIIRVANHWCDAPSVGSLLLVKLFDPVECDVG